MCDRVFIAPEVHQTLRLTTKADVYCFGALILETISGCTRYNYMFNHTDNDTLTHSVWTNWVKGTSSNIIDPRIHAHSSSITRVIHIGLLCVQVDPADRPTMEEVVGMLTSNSSLPLPLQKKSLSPWIREKSSDVPKILLSDDYDSGAVEDFLSELCPR
uniref:Protein kinase domain-containing protein n=1 Tax=Lactuca sativa TaxID=4236 RepID=A0A9R1VJ17_LACSA|nr:hypothetical protein LSAT_V11C500266370 [Lactuca sativa]